MKKILLVFILLVFNILAIGQINEFYSLKNVNNIYVVINNCDELSKYVTEYEIQQLVETELMNANIKISENEQTKFRLVISYYCATSAGDICVSTSTILYEKIYIKRTKENQWVSVNEKFGIGILPNRNDTKETVLQILKGSMTSFIYEWKKDNQK